MFAFVRLLGRVLAFGCVFKCMCVRTCASSFRCLCLRVCVCVSSVTACMHACVHASVCVCV